MLWPALSETFAIRDVRALIRLGCKVDVMALRPDFRRSDEIANVADIPAKRMGVMAQLRGIVYMMVSILSFIQLTCSMVRHGEKILIILKSVMLYPAVALTVKAIKKNKPDMVHLFWGHYPSMVAWMLNRQGNEIPYTIFLGPYDLAYDYKLTPVVAKNARYVFTHTTPNVQKIIDLGVSEKKVDCVFRGIEMADEPEKVKLDHSYIFVGRLMTAKGIYELIDVFFSIHQAEPKSVLTIIGDGDEKEKLLSYIAEKNLDTKVKLLGWRSPEEVLSVLETHKIMLFLSHVERLPNAVKEAMMMQVMPIASKTTGINAMIQEGINGFIVNYNDDPKQIAEIALGVMNNDKLRLEMSQKARQIILEKFDVMASMKRYLEIWKGLS